MEQIIPLITALNAVTATTTSQAIDITGAEKVTFAFTRAANAGGTSTFSVTGSVDGTTFVTLNNIITNVTNANSEDLTRVASVAIANTNATVVAFLDMEYMTLKEIKVTVTETSDGTHTAKVLVEY